MFSLEGMMISNMIKENVRHRLADEENFEF